MGFGFEYKSLTLIIRNAGDLVGGIIADAFHNAVSVWVKVDIPYTGDSILSFVKKIRYMTQLQRYDSYKGSISECMLPCPDCYTPHIPGFYILTL
jgi:hypothetical protein